MADAMEAPAPLSAEEPSKVLSAVPVDGEDAAPARFSKARACCYAAQRAAPALTCDRAEQAWWHDTIVGGASLRAAASWERANQQISAANLRRP